MKDVHEKIKKDIGIDLLIGRLMYAPKTNDIERHLAANEGYGIVASDTAQHILHEMNQPNSRQLYVRLLNRSWSPSEEEKIFKNSSFTMALLERPDVLEREFASWESTELLDKFILFFAKAGGSTFSKISETNTGKDILTKVVCDIFTMHRTTTKG